ncbi:MAG: dephospho-CoA kinase [Thermoanaerobaculia bacterium]
MLRPDGGVDKVAVARLVFRDAAERERLEQAIHPLVREAFAEIAGAADGVVVLEATRLVEAGFGPDFDLVVTVESPTEMRLERAVARGMSRPEAIARLEAQGDGEERRRGADYLLSNDGDLARLRDETAGLIASSGAGPRCGGVRTAKCARRSSRSRKRPAGPSGEGARARPCRDD